MEIILYNSTAENIRVDKTNYITQILTLDGVLKEQTSIQNPSILIELPENSNALNVNYAYIPNFNRYYFIENISVFRNNLWRYDMSVDVLMSFKEQIYNLDVYVGRQEYEVNELLHDDLMPSNITPIVDKIIPFRVYDKLIDPSTISVTDAPNYRPIIFNVVNDDTTELNYSNYIGYTTAYILNIYNLNDINEFIMTGDFTNNPSLLLQDPSEGTISLKIFPLDLGEYDSRIGTEEVNYIKIGNVKFNITDNFGDRPTYGPYMVKKITRCTPIYKELGEFVIYNHYNNFLDYEPYTSYKLFLPLLGFVDLPANLIINKIVRVLLFVDVISGEGLYKILTGEIDSGYTDFVLKTYPVNIGIDIPLTSSNNADIARKLLLGGINTVLGLLSGKMDLPDVSSKPIETRYRGHKSKAYEKRLEEYNESIDERRNTIRNIAIDTISNVTVDVVKSMQQHVNFGEIGNGYCVFEMGLSPYIYAIRPNPVYYSDTNSIDYTKKYRHLLGSPSSYNGILGNLYGYTQINGCHMEGLNSVSKPEIEEIENIIKSGIIMPDKPIE